MKKKNISYVGFAGDIIHYGHIKIINTASKYGSVVVGLLTDKAISSYKRKPLMNYKQRYTVISNIKNVELVIAQNTLDYTKNLKKIKPKYVVHGDDWKKGPQKKTRENIIKLLSSWNGKLIEVPYTKGISTTKILTHLRKEIVNQNKNTSSSLKEKKRVEKSKVRLK